MKIKIPITILVGLILFYFFKTESDISYWWLIAPFVLQYVVDLSYDIKIRL